MILSSPITTLPRRLQGSESSHRRAEDVREEQREARWMDETYGLHSFLLVSRFSLPTISAIASISELETRAPDVPSVGRS
jgi:hypothetical protein